MVARNTNVPFKGRIRMRKTNHLQIVTFGLQRAAGPYIWASSRTRVLCLRAQLVDRQRTLPLQWSGFRQRPWRVAIFEALTANFGKDASKWKLSAPRFNRSTSLLMGPITACRPWGRLTVVHRLARSGQQRDSWNRESTAHLNAL
jgi:hypothetical protein